MVLDAELRLDVPSLDAEHALLVDLVEALAHAVMDVRAGEVADEILEKLLEYTRVHFVAEELMMRIEGYPDYPAHRAEHAERLAELEKLRALHGRGAEPVTRNTVEGLRSWLAGHVRSRDRAFATFLVGRETGQPAHRP